jgi:hypothetical protein
MTDGHRDDGNCSLHEAARDASTGVPGDFVQNHHRVQKPSIRTTAVSASIGVVSASVRDKLVPVPSYRTRTATVLVGGGGGMFGGGAGVPGGGGGGPNVSDRSLAFAGVSSKS